MPSYDSSLYYTIRQTSEALCISPATARNWLRAGKLKAAAVGNQKTLFLKSDIDALKENLASGQNQSLKSRRNKLYKNAPGLYAAYLQADSKNSASLQQILAITANTILSDKQIGYYIAESALRLYFQTQRASYCPHESQLKQWLTKLHAKSMHQVDTKKALCARPSDENKQTPPVLNSLLTDITGEPATALEWINTHAESFAIDFVYDETEDLLGVLYLSLKNSGSKKASGAYYTPRSLAASLTQELLSCRQSNAVGPCKSGSCETAFSVLDPACGTGSFLLCLSGRLPFSSIYGNDADLLSVQIIRLNFYLRHNERAYQELCSHFTCEDFLLNPPPFEFDAIIGNPPWGSHYDSAYKERLASFHCNKNGKADSFALFLEQSLHLLKRGGTLLFLVPEALLHVHAHRAIREIILKEGKIEKARTLQQAFAQVQCPVISIRIKKITNHASDKTTDIRPSCRQKETAPDASAKGIEIQLNDQYFVIQRHRPLNADFMPLFMTDEEYSLLDRLLHAKNCTTLKGQAEFALGIVTGDNASHLKKEPDFDTEPILKGSDITPFQIAPASSFLKFSPDTLQQHAPLSCYHAPEKLVYRFIGDKLTFAYDQKQRLTLNSCNIVIPRIEGLSIKYVLAVLNSSAAQFIFKCRFHSVKVLRSHLEQIPIPMADEQTQRELVDLAEQLETCQDSKQFQALYSALNKCVMDLYG